MASHSLKALQRTNWARSHFVEKETKWGYHIIFYGTVQMPAPFWILSLYLQHLQFVCQKFFFFNDLQECTRRLHFILGCHQMLSRCCPTSNCQFFLFRQLGAQVALQCRQPTADTVSREAVSMITSHQKRDAPCIMRHIHKADGWRHWEPEH